MVAGVWESAITVITFYTTLHWCPIGCNLRTDEDSLVLSAAHKAFCIDLPFRAYL